MTRVVATMSGLFALVGLVVGLAGCGPAAHRADVTLQRASWDTLRADVTFTRQGPFDQRQPATPDSTTLYLFDASYDTLYAGSRFHLSIPDAHLGDREHLMVEVCGHFVRQTVCDQEGIQASPKRVRVDPTIAYPENGDVEQGRYDMQFVVERKHFSDKEWEPIEPAEAVNAHLMAYVDGQKEGRVKVPLHREHGRFRLARHDGYDDFSFYLNSALYEEERARVFFDVYAGLGGDAARVATVKREVREKQPGERRTDVQHFARQAARQLLDRLTDDDRPRASVYIDQWSFNNITRQYQIDLDVEWATGGFFRSEDYRLQGTLVVSPSGDEVRFQLKDSNRRAQKRWREHVQTQHLTLEALGVPDTAQEPDGPQRAARHDRSRRLRREEQQGW